MIHSLVSPLALATNCHNNRVMDWQRLGQHVIARRVHLKLLRREDLAEATPGLSLRTLGDIETGRRTSYHKNTIATLENALNWAPGSVNSILAGGEAAELPATSTNPTSHSTNAHSPVESATDDALIRVMRSPDLDERTKAKIVRALIAEQERFARERAARADELIRAFRDDT